jgi:hypothetical protein
MKYRIAKTITALAVASAALSGCGGGDGGMSATTSAPAAVPASTTPTMQSLDTAQVLAQARESSETLSPYMVDGGMLRITGTSDSAEPLAIDGN